MPTPSSSLQTLAITINMENNNNNTTHSSRRHQPPAAGGAATRSPRLIRSKSGSSPAISSLPDYLTPTSVHRSKSTTKSRSTKAYPENVMNPSKITTTPSSTQKKLLVPQQGNNNNKDGTFVRFLQRSSQRTSNVVQKRGSPRLTPTSPSAWALSPARSLPFSPVPKSAPSSTSGNVGKVLKYFRHKKVAPVQEMEYRKYGLLHNNLLQWRYGNARAEVAMASVKIIAEVIN